MTETVTIPGRSTIGTRSALGDVYPTRRSSTRRKGEAQAARTALATYQRDVKSLSDQQATLDLLRAMAACERALYLQTNGRMGDGFATVRTVARKQGLEV